MTDEAQTELAIAIDRLVRTSEFIQHKTAACNGLSKCKCGLAELRRTILDGVRVLEFELKLERDGRRTAQAELEKLRRIPDADEWAERIDRDTGCGPVARARIADALRAMRAIAEAANGGQES